MSVIQTKNKVRKFKTWCKKKDVLIFIKVLGLNKLCKSLILG